MKIGIIGAGNVATGLAKYWHSNGHELFFSYSRDMEKLKSTAEGIGAGARFGSPKEAVEFADVVVLAVPFSSLNHAMESAGSMKGKLIFSCVNALKPDYSGLAVGTTTSAAEEIAKLTPEARVVEGLPAFAELLHSGKLRINGQQATVFVSGDDQEAKGIVAGLLKECDLDVVDAGPLWSSRYVEPAMMLLVNLAYAQGLGGRVAFKLLRES
jgi:8-hydroxy-5-deazaflavin:NADPH oxidoreductase